MCKFVGICGKGILLIFHTCEIHFPHGEIQFAGFPQSHGGKLPAKKREGEFAKEGKFTFPFVSFSSPPYKFQLHSTVSGTFCQILGMKLIMADGQPLNPFGPEFTIVIFIHYKARIAVAILHL